MITDEECPRKLHADVCPLLNRVNHGDSNDIMRRIPSKSVDVVVTDPPYGIDFKTGFRTTNMIQTAQGIANDGADNVEMLQVHANELGRITKPDAHVYWFTRWDKAGDHSKLLENAGFKVKNHLVWKKNNWSMGDLKGAYAGQYETIIFAQKGNKPLNCVPTADGRLNKHGNPEICRHADVLEFNRVGSGKAMMHNHQKPTDLLEFLITKSSQPGDVVFDGFLGSGSTAVAAQTLDRNWIGIELDSEIAKLAVSRLEATPLPVSALSTNEAYDRCVALWKKYATEDRDRQPPEKRKSDAEIAHEAASKCDNSHRLSNIANKSI